MTGVRRSLVGLQGPRFKLRPGQKFETRFLVFVHLCSASGATLSGTRASPKLGNSPKKWVGEWSTDGCRHISRKEEKRMKSHGMWRRVNGKTPRYGMRKERWWTLAKAQDTRASPNSLENHLMRKWGTLDTYGRWAHGAIDGWIS